VYFDRDISKFVITANETFPVVLITGLHQVGKSTVLEQIKENNRKPCNINSIYNLILTGSFAARKRCENISTFGKINVTASKGAMVCLYENLLPLNRNVQIVPAGYLS
jgi:hypothetical protein